MAIEKGGVTNGEKAGRLFDYSSANTQMLGLIAERVSGKRLADLFSERIWSKIGAEGDAMLAVDDSGYPSIFAFISSRLRDKARYGMLYTPSWNKVAGERVIPESLIKKIQKDCRPELYQRAVKAAGEEWGFSYDTDVVCNSRQWDAVYKDGDMYKLGLHGQGIYVSPARDLVVACFSTSPYHWQDYARAVAKAVAPIP